ncbi:MAG: M28 family peptidase [Planctomycetes bacterium]|nr:M28 family peptidase [Planctomycetota bacterium]
MLTLSPAGTEIPISDVLSRVVAFNPSPEADSYAEFLASLPVDEGEDRGYDQAGRPRPGLLSARSAIHAGLSASLLPSGGTVDFEDFTVRGVAGRNIVGVLPGDGPEATRRYLIGAHYDSVQNPGADDNGSGVAGVLLAANVLAPFRFEATLAFALLDLEEQRDCGWGLGSRAHAAAARRHREDLRGVVVLDMIAHDHDGAGRAVVSRSGHRRRGGSADLAADLLAAVAAHTRVAARAETGDDGSDHFRFARRGFPAVLLIEDLDEALLPRNPYWHTRHDFFRNGAGQEQEWSGRPYIDVEYATDLVRAVVAWATDAAGLLGPR